MISTISPFCCQLSGFVSVQRQFSYFSSSSLVSVRHLYILSKSTYQPIDMNNHFTYFRIHGFTLDNYNIFPLSKKQKLSKKKGKIILKICNIDTLESSASSEFSSILPNNSPGLAYFAVEATDTDPAIKYLSVV